MAAGQARDSFAPPLKIPLYPHQQVCYRHACHLHRAALLMEQGTGKTLVAIGLMGYRHLKHNVSRILVVAPLSVVPFWKTEIERSADFPVKVVDLTGKDTEDRDQLLKSLKGFKGAQVALINYESTWRYFTQLNKFEAQMIIADESQKIKNPTAKQAKALHKLSEDVLYRIIMTGTPVTQSPLDIWSQYRFLAPPIFGYSFARFRNRYAVMGGYGGYEVVAYQNLDELATKAHGIAYRLTKAEALDLPPTVDQELYAHLEGDPQRLYDELNAEFGTLLNSGESVSVPIVLTKMLRLQQITGGFVKADSGQMMHVSNAKLQELKELLSDLPVRKKVVIFARFIPEVKTIAAMAESMGRKVLILDGSSNNRGYLVNKFQTDPEYTVFVAQIQSGGVGITLTAADTVIFYSTTFSYADYEQARARVHRIGQGNSVTYIHLLVKDTIDEDILTAIRAKKDVAEYIVDKSRAKYK